MKPPRFFNAVAACLLAAAPALADPGFSLGSLHVDAGSTVSIPLTLSGASNVVAFQADVTFDAAILSAGAATAGPALGLRVLDSSQPASGVRRVLIYSPDNAPLSNGVIANLPFTAMTRPSLTVTPISFANVIVTTTNADALASTTSPGTITVNLAPFITAQPQNLTAVAGGPAVFTVSAVGTAPLTYQWRFNASNIPGATNSTLLLTNVQPAQEGIYRVFIANALKTTVSIPATLSVAFPPSITQQPLGTNAAAGSSVTLFVGVTGTPQLRYQWRRNGASLSGATGAALVLPNIQQTQAGDYDVVVTNAVGVAVSSAASVTVFAPVRLGWVADTTNGQPRFRLTWTANSDFVIQASTNLTDWQPLMTNAAPGRVYELIDPAPGLLPQLFFRAKNWP